MLHTHKSLYIIYYTIHNTYIIIYYHTNTCTHYTVELVFMTTPIETPPVYIKCLHSQKASNQPGIYGGLRPRNFGVKVISTMVTYTHCYDTLHAHMHATLQTHYNAHIIHYTYIVHNTLH